MSTGYGSSWDAKQERILEENRCICEDKSIRENIPCLVHNVPEPRAVKPLPHKYKISIHEEEDGMLRAEWYPPRSGLPIVGRGATVLEAVGSLVIYDQVVALEPTPFVDTRFSCEEPACPRR